MILIVHKYVYYNLRIYPILIPVRDDTRIHPRLFKQYFHYSATLRCLSSNNTVTEWVYNKRFPIHRSVVIAGNKLIFSRINNTHAGEYYCYGFDANKNRTFVAQSLLILISKFCYKGNEWV